MKKLCLICLRDIDEVGWSVSSKSNVVCIECEHDLINEHGHEGMKEIIEHFRQYYINKGWF